MTIMQERERGAVTVKQFSESRDHSNRNTA